MKKIKLIGFAIFAVLMCLSACSGGDDSIEPTQKPEVGTPIITLDSSIQTSGLSFDTSATEKSISFSVTSDWTLSIAETRSGTDWCKASPTSGGKGTANVKFTTTENTEHEDRSVAVTIKAGTTSKTFTVTQKGKDALLVTTKKYELPKEGGEIEIEVKANVKYQMTISETTKEWITEVAGRALTTHKHILNIAASEESVTREGEIIFKSGDIIETVKIYQAGEPKIILSKNELYVSDIGETITVDLQSNVEYGIQMPDVDWIKAEEASRSMSSHTLKYIVAPNETYDNRSAEIIFFDKNGVLKDTLKVVQAQKDAIVISEKNISVAEGGETIEVKVNTNVDFEVQIPSDATWISQADSRALTEKNIYLKVDENIGEESRSVEVVFVNKESQIYESITIKQAARAIILLLQKEYIVSEAGETISVEIKSNVEFGVQMPNVDWITDEASFRGMSSHTFKYRIAPNDGSVRKEKIIYFDKNNTISDTLTIVQSKGYHMIELSDNVSMHSKGIALQYSGIKSFNDFFDAKYDEAIGKEIYSKFEDAFDFIFFLYNVSGEDFLYGGFAYPINRDISGIGRENVDISSRFGNPKKLKSISHLTSRTSIFSAGPFLHELGHYWGAAYIGQEHALTSGTFGTESHWGTSDINGILGGFDYKTLKRNVDGNPQKYWATSTRAQEWGFNGFSQEISNGYYAPLELYLMGLVPSDSVPDMHIFKNVTIETDTSTDGTFYADSEITLTIEEFIAKYGERIPDCQSSQKDFRALVVVVTNEPVSDEHWSLIESDILKQEKQGTLNDKFQTNFWEATGGRATLTFSGIDKFLK